MQGSVQVPLEKERERERKPRKGWIGDECELYDCGREGGNELLPPILTSGHQTSRVNFNVIEKLMI